MHRQTDPIELHYWPTSNGYKISIMLEELGVPYVVKFVNIGIGDQFNPDFLAIAPNNRMPAIVDPEGPAGAAISIFESGAILQYLGRKFGAFYPADERGRVEVDQWLMWQMGGFGPMLGQNHHFNTYAGEDVTYAKTRYTNETHRLYGVLNKQLEGQDYICSDYSIADLACYGWARGWDRQKMTADDFPNVMRWLAHLGERPAVQRGVAVGAAEREKFNLSSDKSAKDILFNQRAR